MNFRYTQNIIFAQLNEKLWLKVQYFSQSEEPMLKNKTDRAIFNLWKVYKVKISGSTFEIYLVEQISVLNYISIWKQC